MIHIYIQTANSSTYSGFNLSESSPTVSTIIYEFHQVSHTLCVYCLLFNSAFCCLNFGSCSLSKRAQESFSDVCTKISRQQVVRILYLVWVSLRPIEYYSTWEYCCRLDKPAQKPHIQSRVWVKSVQEREEMTTKRDYNTKDSKKMF